MKFTRTQELALIEIGLNALLRGVTNTVRESNGSAPVKRRKRRRKMSAEARKAHSLRMQKVWAAKRAARDKRTSK